MGPRAEGTVSGLRPLFFLRSAGLGVSTKSSSQCADPSRGPTGELQDATDSELLPGFFQMSLCKGLGLGAL